MPKITRYRVIPLLFLAALLPLSILNGIAAGYDGSTADLNQWSRFAKFGAIYLMAAMHISADADNMDNILRTICRCGYIVAAVMIAQYFDIGGLNAVYVPIVAPTQWQAVVGHPSPRPVAMIGNPNVAGFLLVLVTIAAAFRFMRVRSSILLIPLSGVMIIITLSRGSFTAYLIALAVFAAFYAVPRISFRGMLWLSATATLAVYVATRPIVWDTFIWRFESVFSEGREESSVSARIENWEEHLEIARSVPILGAGPLRGVEFQHASDNEWILLWRTYGAVGVSIFVFMLVAPNLSLTWRRRTTVSWATTAACFAYMIPAGAFHQNALFGLLMVILACTDTGDSKPPMSKPRQPRRLLVLLKQDLAKPPSTDLV